MYGNLGVGEIVVILVVAVVFGIVFTVVPLWFIFKKAGYHPALSLIAVIPLGGVVLRFFLAFSDWPSLKKSAG